MYIALYSIYFHKRLNTGTLGTRIDQVKIRVSVLKKKTSTQIWVFKSFLKTFSYIHNFKYDHEVKTYAPSLNSLSFIYFAKSLFRSFNLYLKIR